MVNGDLCMTNRLRLFLVCILEFSITKKDERMCLWFSVLLLTKCVGLTVLRIRTFCMYNPQAAMGITSYLVKHRLSCLQGEYPECELHAVCCS